MRLPAFFVVSGIYRVLINSMMQPTGEEAGSRSLTAARAFRAFLLEKPTSDGLPLFESTSVLANALAESQGGHYPKKKSNEALFSQIFRGIRPIPQRLANEVAQLFLLGSAQRQALGSKALLADFHESVAKYNEAIGLESNLEGKFDEEIRDFRTQIIFVSEGLFTLSSGGESAWNRLICGQAQLLISGLDSKIEYFVRRPSFAFRMWELFDYAIRAGLRSAMDQHEEAGAKNASALLDAACINKLLQIHIIDGHDAIPSPISQIAFFPKTAPTVYVILQGELCELSEEEASHWREDFKEWYKNARYRSVSWSDYRSGCR